MTEQAVPTNRVATEPGPFGAVADEAAGGDGAMAAVAFIGASLAPFFLNDPRTGDAADAFAALAELDAEAAAAEWPFVEEAEARASLAAMVRGLAAGADNEELVWEHRRLFVGPGHLPAPPWGSVYTDRECVVFGEATLALRAWMRRIGVARTTDERTPAPVSSSTRPIWPRNAPNLRTSTCATTCSPGRRTIWKPWRRRPIIPSIRASPR